MSDVSKEGPARGKERPVGGIGMCSIKTVAGKKYSFCLRLCRLLVQKNCRDHLCIQTKKESSRIVALAMERECVNVVEKKC